MDDSRAASTESTPPFVIFDTLQAVALFILIVTIVPPLFSRHMKRMKTWFALIISSMMYCTSFLLLVGRQSGPSPPFGLCVYQAGLIYAAPPTVAASALIFVVELHWRLFSALANVELKHARMDVLLFFPPIVHLVVFFLPLFNGLSHPLLVERVPTGMYCHINDKIPTTVTGVIVVILLVLMILVECYTISYLWQRRNSCQDIRVNGSDGHYPFQSFVRVTVYTLVGGLGIIMVDLFVNTLPDGNPAASFLLAIIPLSVALLFGSQMDIIYFYLHRKAKWTPLTPISQDTEIR